MPYQKELIRYLQNNDILALKLEKALKGVAEMVSAKIDVIGSGFVRLSTYATCFTTSYQGICRQQGKEDYRFTQAIIILLRNESIFEKMLSIYFNELIKYKTYQQIEVIKKGLMAVNVYVAASSLTNAVFAFGLASAVVLGANLSIDISILNKRYFVKALAAAGIYGIVQKAADSALRLKFASPTYYNALYIMELEMLYFVIEPLFIRADAFSISSPSEQDIINIITKMVR